MAIRPLPLTFSPLPLLPLLTYIPWLLYERSPNRWLAVNRLEYACRRLVDWCWIVVGWILIVAVFVPVWWILMKLADDGVVGVIDYYKVRKYRHED